MKVKELIEKLSVFDGELEIIDTFGDTIDTVEGETYWDTDDTQKQGVQLTFVDDEE